MRTIFGVPADQLGTILTDLTRNGITFEANPTDTKGTHYNIKILGY